jgi:hypothetical protein
MTSNDIDLARAKAFCVAAHSAVGQTRKYTGEPYWHHPLEVAALIRTHVPGAPAEVLIAANTSRQCPACDHTHADNRKSQSIFLCLACGHTENADLVAAKNIRERGFKLLEGPDMARIACEVNGAARPSAAGTHRSDEAAKAA